MEPEKSVNQENLHNLSVAPELAQKALSDGQPSKEILELKKEILELREQLLKLREAELLPIKEKIDAFSLQIKSWLAIGGALAVFLAGCGIKQVSDLNDLVNKGISKKLDESTNYYDQLSRALILVNNGGCSSAIPLLTDLSEKRPEDEVAFQNAVHCFNMLEEYDKGYEFLSKLKGQGFFPRKYKLMLSHHNPAFLIFVKSLKDPKFENEALELFRKAEEIGTSDDGAEVFYPLYGLLLFYTAQGNTDKASVYASKIDRLGMSDKIDWRKDIDTIWFNQLVTKRSDVRLTLEKLLPLSDRSESTTLPSSRK
jgi:hypothetical protein